jgi:hypothetical protein
MRLSASKGALLRECAYSFRPDVVTRPGPPSDEQANGTATHHHLDTYARQGVILPTDNIEVAAMFGHGKAWLDALADTTEPVHTEQPFAWHPETDRGWSLLAAVQAGGHTGHRPYADPVAWADIARRAGCPLDAIPMTIDLIYRDGLYDWCTGRTDKAAQLELNALAFARAFDLDSVTVCTLRLDPGGLREEGKRTLEAFDLAALAEEYRGLVRGIPTAEPRPGMWCSAHYCEAIDACPATEALKPQLVPASALLAATHWPFSAAIQSDEHAAALIPLVKLAESFLKGVKGALEERATKQGSIATRPGYVWREGTRQMPRFDRPLAEALLGQLGATKEQIAALTKMRTESSGFREVKAKP